MFKKVRIFLLILGGFLAVPLVSKAAYIEIAEDTIWQGERIVEDRINVLEGATLSINSGSKLEFKEGGRLEVRGKLLVNGEKEKPVLFFRKKKKTGDPKWAYAIVISNGGEAIMNWAIIREAGGYTESGIARAIYNFGNLEIYDSLITDCTWAINIYGEGHLKMRNSDIYENNTSWGVQTFSDQAVADVRENYWHDDSGPYHSIYHKEGKGENIVGENIQFEPWLKRGKRPIILVPGFGESLNFGKLLFEQEGGAWHLFPSQKSIKGLKKAFEKAGYEVDKDLFIAYYDWRKKTKESAFGVLDPLIKKVKEQTGFKEIDLVAFSFGGLVSRSYIQDANYKFDINHFFTISTPHKGVSKIYPFAEGGVLPKDYNSLLYVYLWYKGLSNKQLPMSYIKESIPAVYELMPVYNFLKDAQTNEPKEYKEMTYYNQTLDELNEEIDVLRDRVSPFFIGGTGYKTIDEIKVKPCDGCLSGNWPDGMPAPFPTKGDSTEGDGTVLKKSSLWPEKEIDSVFLVGPHGDMPLESIERMERILKMGLEVSLDPNDFLSEYLIIAVDSSSEVQITDSQGNVSSGQISQIPFSYLDQDVALGKKIFTLYQPAYEHLVKIKGIDEGNYRMLAYLNETLAFDEYAVSAYEDQGGLALNEEKEFLVIRRTDLSENPQIDGSKIEIVEKITPSYQKVARKIKDYYSENNIKDWDDRQTLLAKFLTGYDFKKRTQKEDEGLVLEEVKTRINNLVALGGIDKIRARVMMEVIDKLHN